FQDRNVIPYAQSRWPNKEVPYVIDKSLTQHTDLIKSAMKNYHDFTCLKFVPRTNQRNYIKLFFGQGCYSYIGLINRGEQLVSLGQGCHYKGIVVHELGHAIGFFHEHSRSDRDKYVTIYWQNIKNGMEPQFTILRPNQNLLLTPFDYDSIMLYGNYAFSKDNKSMTIAAKDGRPLKEPYQKPGLTSSDIKRVNLMYKC
ncbi:astacin-like metalloprotease toxin 1, partial [Stegodyphus dumicola]|uniref:astacin-like metalloprotease toxin 1 n=1 Tax=Stegodyphus dumicola TaxID=202533 RepID=UPI0015A88479